MDENDASTHLLLCRLISFQIAVAKKLAFESQWVKWKQNWNFRSFKIRKVELLHHLCALPTVPAMSVGDVCRGSADLVIWFNMINVTEHSSLPSLPTPFAKWLLLSSLCRMETAPGFSPWKLIIPHCGMPCIVFNFPINNFSQHFFARTRNCRGWCHDAHSDMGRCYQLVATLTLRGNTHTQIIPNPSQSSKHLISNDNSIVKRNLAFESQWVKWKQIAVAKKTSLRIQGHQFHPDSQEKQEWILELSFGNAGPSSQANIYKSMPWSAFKSMSLLGFKKWNRLRAIGY